MSSIRRSAISAWIASRRVPTGSIDHWFVVQQPFTLDEQLGWLELPPEPVIAAPAVDALEDEATALLDAAHKGRGWPCPGPRHCEQAAG